MPVRKIIEHETPDGVPVQSEWYFSLGKSDMAEMDLAHMEDPGKYLQDLIDQKDSRAMMDLWQQMLFHAVGIREGDLIIKDTKDDKSVSRRFRGCGAYDAFFGSLMEMPDAGFQFFISIMPADIQKKIAENTPEEREYSDSELLAMPEDEFRRIAGPNEKDWDRRYLMIGMKRKMAA
ncbi:hypothetical protein SEA_GIRLPOWER_44 [Streptomyces phage GirlPower]|nr:hypothetical protein SEA_GIRLPOWER_44 [Streptomyces phage GirlPower]